MTGTLTFYDAAWPPVHPPKTDGVCIYIGGDTLHVWTRPMTSSQPARYRLPIFVRSNPPGPGADARGLRRGPAKVIGAPHGKLVALDTETAADAAYIGGRLRAPRGGRVQVIVYGSQSAVIGNQNPDGLLLGRRLD